MGQNATDLSKLQAYAEKFQAELITLAMMSAAEMQAYFNVITGVTDKYTMTGLQFKKLLKPYKRAWNPNEDKVGTVPRTLRVETGQVELEEEPEAYRKTSLGHLLKPGATQHPFERQFLDGIMKQLGQDINNDLLFHGVKNANGTNPKDVNDGFHTIIDNEIAGGGISEARGNLIATGSISSSDAVDKCKAMYRGLPKAWRSVPLDMKVSYVLYDKYCDDYQNSNNALPYNTQFNKTFLEGSNQLCTLVPLASMGDTDRIIISPRQNLCVGVDLMSGKDTVEVFKPSNPKVIGFFSKFSIGFQIASLRAIWVNDQAADSVSGSGSAFL